MISDSPLKKTNLLLTLNLNFQNFASAIPGALKII